MPVSMMPFFTRKSLKPCRIDFRRGVDQDLRGVGGLLDRVGETARGRLHKRGHHVRVLRDHILAGDQNRRVVIGDAVKMILQHHAV
jgi:hypothetical protein